MAVAVLLGAIEVAQQISCRRNAARLECTQEPPAEYVVIQLCTHSMAQQLPSHNNGHVYSRTAESLLSLTASIYYIISYFNHTLIAILIPKLFLMSVH